MEKVSGMLRAKRAREWGVKALSEETDSVCDVAGAATIKPQVVATRLESLTSDSLKRVICIYGLETSRSTSLSILACVTGNESWRFKNRA